MPKPVTMKQIGERVGCSSVAVSKALRNDPEISEETRNKIRQVARELGYRPNPLVSALMASRGSRGKKAGGRASLAILSYAPMDSAAREAHPNYVDQLAGIHARAEELGFSTESIDTDSGQVSPARMEKILRARGIRGLIVFPERELLPYLKPLRHQMAIACAGGHSGYSEYPLARTAAFTNMTLALEAIREAGYRRIGFISNIGLEEAVSRHYYAAYAAFLAFESEMVPLPPFVTGRDEAHGSIAQWLKAHQPEAVIGTRGVATLLTEKHGCRLPEDLAFALIDRRETDSGFAGFDSRHDQQGAAAIDLVSGQLYRNETADEHGFKHLVVRGRWVAGTSLPVPRT